MSTSPILLMMHLLQQDTDVAAAVSDRIYAQIAPQMKQAPGAGPCAPYIVVRQVGRSEGRTLDGPSGLIDARVVVMCFGAQFAAAEQVAEAVTSVARAPGRREVDGHAVMLLLEGVNTSDFLPAQQISRRTIEVRLLIAE